MLREGQRIKKLIGLHSMQCIILTQVILEGAGNGLVSEHRMAVPLS